MINTMGTGSNRSPSFKKGRWRCSIVTRGFFCWNYYHLTESINSVDQWTGLLGPQMDGIRGSRCWSCIMWFYRGTYLPMKEQVGISLVVFFLAILLHTQRACDSPIVKLRRKFGLVRLNLLVTSGAVFTVKIS
jgi:hypothetical protein